MDQNKKKKLLQWPTQPFKSINRVFIGHRTRCTGLLPSFEDESAPRGRRFRGRKGAAIGGGWFFLFVWTEFFHFIWLSEWPFGDCGTMHSTYVRMQMERQRANAGRRMVARPPYHVAVRTQVKNCCRNTVAFLFTQVPQLPAKFYRVVPSFTEFHLFLSSFIPFHLVLLSFT